MPHFLKPKAHQQGVVLREGGSESVEVLEVKVQGQPPDPVEHSHTAGQGVSPEPPDPLTPLVEGKGQEGK